MMRLKIPGGVVSSEQTRFLASVIAKYGDAGCADITTRQNFQLRGVLLPDMPAILEGCAARGLTSLQSGLDNVRNAVGNPLAGIDPLEVLDSRPATQALHDYVTNYARGNPEVSNLPRKWNVCVVGSHELWEQCAPPQWRPAVPSDAHARLLLPARISTTWPTCPRSATA
jgi:ferredoxin-nitrite reductase